MPTILFFLFLITLLTPQLSSSTKINQHRRILHQPFFPLDSSLPPTTQPPLLSPQSQPIKYPFSTTQSPPNPFFPFYPSPPPPPPPPPSTSSLATFPANISSLILPQSSSSSSKPISRKLVAVAVGVSLLSLSLIVFIAAFLVYHRRHRRSFIDKKKADPRSDNLRLFPPNTATSDKPQPPPSSSEFLYLGTVGNSRSINDDEEAHISSSNVVVGGSSSFVRGYQKLGSPELHPLPPLPRHNNLRHNAGEILSSFEKEDDVEEEEEFFSPRGSSGGKGSPPSFVGSRSSGRGIGFEVEGVEAAAEYLGRPSINSRSSNASSSPPSSSSSLSSSSSSCSNNSGGSPVQSISSTRSSRSINPLHHSNINLRSKSPDDDDSVFEIPPPSRPPPPIPIPIPTTLVSSSSLFIAVKLPPPPPPPPPPRFWETPPPVVVVPRPIPDSMAGPPVLVAPSRPVVSSSLIGQQQQKSSLLDTNDDDEEEEEEETPKPKLKPLHWDKVRASSDRAMVWDQLKSSSFQLNEEMIETLFMVNGSNLTLKDRPVLPYPYQENRVLDPKKSQNIAILLRALNVTVDEVCEALLEGNADTVGTELLESLLKMAPTKEEERKLREFKDESPFKLGPAEKFLKAVLDVPFAFKRVDAMLYIANFDSEVEYLKRSFQTIEAACEELRKSRMFMKLLEAVLKTGNRMNIGTNRGDAQAFKLDTLLKLVDIKGTDGKTTLLHFVVQEIIRAEGSRLSGANLNSEENHQSALRDDVEFRKLGLQVVSGLSGELTNVKKAAAMDSDILSSEVEKLARGITKIVDVLKLDEEIALKDSTRKFFDSVNEFLKKAEEDLIKMQAQESVALSKVKEITEYFHGNSVKEEAHPFRIFMVVRDFLSALDQVCKEVGKINERSMVSSARQFPLPTNPSVPPIFVGFNGKQHCSSSDDDDTSSSP